MQFILIFITNVVNNGIALGLFQRLPYGLEGPVKKKLDFKYVTLKRR